MRGSLHYRDPLDEIWLTAARRIGFKVERTRDAYARVDDRGTIFVAETDLLDPDDCLAQMLLHELCHALVEGEGAWRSEDWGLDNMTARDLVREQACLRLQAALASPHGLRRLLAATTEHRTWYDALPEDPLAGDEPSVALARAGLARAGRHPFAPHLEQALAATASVAAAAARFASGEGSLWTRVDAPAERHPTGFVVGPAGETCGGCAWRTARGTCRQADSARVSAAWRACVRWEGPLDCLACAACCSAGGFDAVPLTRRDRVVRSHPELVVSRAGAIELLRDGAGHCAARRSVDGRFPCAIYDERPKTCRDFPVAGQSCLEARRRLGMSR